MRFPDGQKIDKLTGKQGFKSRYKIHQNPQRNLPEGLSFGQIFRQHDHIIPEIQKYFSFISFRQCSTAYMVHFRSRTGINTISQQLQAPAEINFFHMRKKISIQTLRLDEIIQPAQTSAAPLAQKIFCISLY